MLRVMQNIPVERPVFGGIMEWYQLFMLGVGLFSMHRENIAIQRENTKLYNESKSEMKDFHGRLCKLEEKYIQMMERFMEKK